MKKSIPLIGDTASRAVVARLRSAQTSGSTEQITIAGHQRHRVNKKVSAKTTRTTELSHAIHG
jgi:Flp pilus assembly protein TadG